jgi:circadian clock protein KaiC
MNAVTSSGAARRVPSGVAGLDMVLGGGFIPGGIYIVQGSPGAGKTIFTNQLCFAHVASGGSALFVTLLAENHARMMGNMRGLAFFDQSVIPDRLIYLSAFTEMRDGGMKGLLRLLRVEIQRRRVSVLVIDGFVSVHTSSVSDESFKEFVHDLQEIALATDCTMFLTTNDGRPVSPERTMVDGLIVLSERIYGWQAASDLQVTKFRGSGFLKGRHSYQITDRGITVFPRIEALYASPAHDFVSPGGRTTSGVEKLDAIFSGGLPIASTTMLMGPSGIGKTTLGLQFLAKSSAAEPGLMFSFYETPARLRIKAEQIDPCFPSLLDRGEVTIHWQTPTSDVLDAYGQRLLDAIREKNIKRLFIDGLTAFKNGAIDPTRVGNFFSALANELRVLGVTTIYTLEVQDVLWPTLRLPIEDASSLAENMILMRFVAKGASLHRTISVLKVRDSGFDMSVHAFTISNEGVQISATSESAEAILSPDHRSSFDHGVSAAPRDALPHGAR